MIKALEIAIEKLKRLPEDKQAYAAEVIEEIAAADGEPFRIPDDHLPGVLEGLAQAERGEFASEEEVERALRRPWRRESASPSAPSPNRRDPRLPRPAKPNRC